MHKANRLRVMGHRTRRTTAQAMKCLNPCQNKSELSLLQGAAYLLGGWHELGLSNIQSKKKSHYYYYYSNYNYYQMLRGNSLVVQ